MSTLRIDRGKWHRLGNMTFIQYWLESTLADGVGNDQISKPGNTAASDREPQRRFATVNQNSAPNINDSHLAVVAERPAVRGWRESYDNAVVVLKLVRCMRRATARKIIGRSEETPPNLGDLSCNQRRIVDGSGAYPDIGVLRQ